MRINGTQVQCYLLSKEFAARGHDVHYISGTRDPKKVACKYECRENVHIHWVQTKSKTYFEKAKVNAFVALLREIFPDIVYQRGRSYFTYIAGQYCQLNKKKFIWASNGENGCEPRKFVPNLLKSSKSLAAKTLLLSQAFRVDLAFQKGIRMASVHVNQTEQQVNDLKTHFLKEGVIIKSAHPYSSSIEKGDNPKIVLWLANLIKGKQPEIFTTLSHEFENSSGWKFILAGGTSDSLYQSQIEEKAKNIKNLEIIGAVSFEQSYSHFANASIFINTSRLSDEGLPNAMVQSWLAATPVISLNVDPDNLISRYAMGMFAKSDMNCLIENCRTLMEDDRLRHEMGDNSRKYAKRFFDIKVIGDQYESLMT